MLNYGYQSKMLHPQSLHKEISHPENLYPQFSHLEEFSLTSCSDDGLVKEALSNEKQRKLPPVSIRCHPRTKRPLNGALLYLVSPGALLLR